MDPTPSESAEYVTPTILSMDYGNEQEMLEAELASKGGCGMCKHTYA